MYLTKLTVENWLPFRGIQTIELGPTCYGIIAEVVGQSGRSNWSGKTSLLEAIPFALFGTHRKRTEDEWIHGTEQRGSVRLEFDTGLVITRSRVRGGSTIVEVRARDGSVYRQSSAQQAIERELVMGRQDFYTTCFFKQKDIAALVYADPATRAAEFSAWLRLGKLEASHATVGAEIGALQEKRVRATLRLTGVRDAVERLGVEPPITQDAIIEWKALLEDTRPGLQEAMDAALTIHKDAFEACVVEARRVAVLATHARNAVRCVELRNELAACSVSDASLQVAVGECNVARVNAEAARASLANAKAEMDRTAALCRGEFDGVCPVNEAQCPVAASIRASNEASKAIHVRAKERVTTLANQYRVVKEGLESSKATEARLRSQIARAVACTSQLDRLLESGQPRSSEPSRLAELEKDRDRAHDRFLFARDAVTATATKIDALGEHAREMQSLEEDIAELDRELVVRRAAHHIFGRNGAQRIIAEAAIETIVRGGNEMLAQAGVDLSFGMTWAREGKGLASVCQECGSGFPTSVKIKACTRCGADRGAKIVEKSEITFSQCSGAAEDMVGGVLRLSAGRWFRRTRGCSWGFVAIDEPFGALDEANREAYAGLLAAVLRPENGFGQSFIVAHHQDVLSALPGSIRVIREPLYEWSRLEMG